MKKLLTERFQELAGLKPLYTLKEKIEFSLDAWLKGKDYEGPMLDPELMFFHGSNPEFLDTAEYRDEMEFDEDDVQYLKDKFVGQDKISAAKYEELYRDYQSKFREFYVTDSWIGGLKAHMKKELLSPEEAGIALLILNGEGDKEASEEILNTFNK